MAKPLVSGKLLLPDGTKLYVVIDGEDVKDWSKAERLANEYYQLLTLPKSGLKLKISPKSIR